MAEHTVALGDKITVITQEGAVTFLLQHAKWSANKTLQDGQIAWADPVELSGERLDKGGDGVPQGGAGA